MNSLRIGCAIFCILLVISAGCVLPGQTGNTTLSKDTGPQKARQALSFGDAPSEETKAVVAPTPKPTIQKTPAFHGSSSRTINGSGLSNSTNSTSNYSKHIINQSQTKNQTLLKLTIDYWNKQSKIIASRMDSENQVTHDFALRSINSQHGGSYNVNQVCDIWDNVTTKWTYVNDPVGSEYNNYASESISLGLRGDCDDHAILNAALINSIGGNARVVLATSKTGDSGHAYAEARITDSGYEKTIQERYGKKIVYSHTGNWISLDWFDSYPGGRFFEDNGVITAVYKSGTWEMYSVSGTNTTLFLQGG